MIKYCENISYCHDVKELADTDTMRVICKNCKQQHIIRKEPVKDVPEKRSYAKIYKKDILQGNDNLFYKYHPEYLTN